ncbi:hypothetical protein GCM10023238_10410 [Streptomyces heliomycini]
MRICPGADLTDGLFDITVVGECSRATLLRVFPGVYRERTSTTPRSPCCGRRAWSWSPRGVTGYADGEPVGPLPLTARCVPGALRSSVPEPGGPAARRDGYG